MASCCCSSLRALVICFEEHLALEQGAKHIEQAITDAAQRPTMAVSSVAQRRISVSTGRIMLDGDACPMIDCIAQSVVAGESPQHDQALAAAASDRGHSRQQTQNVVISSPQRLASLGEQRGDGDPSEPWTGTQDRHVALLANLSR